MKQNSTKIEEDVEEVDQVDISDILSRKIVLFNDDVNTFENVISSLRMICQHTWEQAEQCAWIVHHKGKCVVKEGTVEDLKPRVEALCEHGLDARLL